jgi:AcrR family transcriptional regulator
MAERVYESPLREEQAAATRERILGALRDLIVEEHPANVTMADVAKRAKVSERTVYRHYPTREELFHALFTWAVTAGEDLSPTRASDPAGLIAMAHRMFPLLEANADIVRALNAMPLATDMRAHRAERRRSQVIEALEPVTASLAPDSARRLQALAHLLTSSDSLLFMKEYWGFDGEEAAKAVAWAIGALTDRAGTKKGAP